MEAWPSRWESEGGQGKWSETLIRHVDKSVKRKHETVGYRLTQALARYRCLGD